jgi:sugar phosphate isomerase/epimerase
LVFGSGGARALPEGFPRARAEEQFVELLKRLAPEAEKSGVTIVVEPLHKKECNFINSLAEGAEMVERCGHPSVQLLADVFHMLRDGEPAGEILRFGRMLRHTHIAEKEKRTAPGTAGDDFRPYLRALRQVNYLGRMAIECSLPDLAADSRRGLEALRRQYAEAAP